MIFCVEMTTEDPSLQSAASTSAQTEPSILTTTAVNVPVPAWSDPLAKDDAVIENKSEFYSMLEDFTETCDDELTKICHRKLSKVEGNKKYKCTKCGITWQYLHEADSHFLEHQHSDCKGARETIKKAEEERAKDYKSMSKIEKVWMKGDKKKLTFLLSKIISNLRNHEFKVQSLQTKDMYTKLKSKREEVLSLLQRSIAKAEEMLGKAHTLKN